MRAPLRSSPSAEPDRSRFYAAVWRTFRVIARLAFRFRVEGAERVPAAGPAILVAPHRSWLDPACVGGACSRQVRFLILDSVYRQTGARWFYRGMRSIPVTQGGFASLGALRTALRALKRGELLGIFPEGRVVRDGERGTVYPGAALLAVRSGAPVLPLAIRGSDRAWPHGRRYPGPARVEVRIGLPLAPPAAHREAVREMAQRIEQALRELREAEWPPRLIAVGSELLLPGAGDRNGDWLTERLLDAGIEVAIRVIVPDAPGAIARAVRGALDACTLVIVGGGLGPTADDRTREALALALDRPLERDEHEVERLRAQVLARGLRFGADHARQADRPHGADWLPNRVGAAAGLWLEQDGRRLAALPGVPSELRDMFVQAVLPRLSAAAAPGRRLRVLHTAGRTESDIDARVRDLYDAPDLDVTILARTTGVDLLLLARGASPDEAMRRLDAAERAFRDRLGDDLCGVDATTLPATVGGLLQAARATLATAESCTAGLLAARITEAPGASGWYRGGFVVYADALKVALAGVEARTLEARGAVSAEVAAELALGAQRRGGADFGLGVTGIAGPAGGSADKPVGLVHVALAGPHALLASRELRLSGGREVVRERAVTLALDLLRRELLHAERGGAR